MLYQEPKLDKHYILLHNFFNWKISFFFKEKYLFKTRIPQNHRIVEFGRHLQHPVEAGFLQEIAQESNQVGLEHLQRRLHSLSGQFVPVFYNPPNK